MIPYVSCMIVATGMFAQFFVVLSRFLRRVQQGGGRDEPVNAEESEPAAAANSPATNEAARRGTVDYYTTPSTCAQFTPRTPHCVMDRRPPGYRWLTLHPDGSHATQVGWLPSLVGTPRQEDEARR